MNVFVHRGSQLTSIPSRMYSRLAPSVGYRSAKALSSIKWLPRRNE